MLTTHRCSQYIESSSHRKVATPALDKSSLHFGPDVLVRMRDGERERESERERKRRGGEDARWRERKRE
jgi:hypothetical protein